MGESLRGCLWQDRGVRARRLGPDHRPALGPRRRQRRRRARHGTERCRGPYRGAITSDLTANAGLTVTWRSSDHGSLPDGAVGPRRRDLRRGERDEGAEAVSLAARPIGLGVVPPAPATCVVPNWSVALPSRQLEDDRTTARGPARFPQAMRRRRHASAACPASRARSDRPPLHDCELRRRASTSPRRSASALSEYDVCASRDQRHGRDRAGFFEKFGRLPILDDDKRGSGLTRLGTPYGAGLGVGIELYGTTPRD